MTDFSLNTTYDVVTIFCDSLNYLPDIDDIVNTFNCVFNHLSDLGMFIFDIHTIYKMNTDLIINVILMIMMIYF